ncbi:MAG: alkaline shock response membrane anchor protein AmaP [Clostridia bacterium]|nr:alkaline shock response membrane anchor protein AmaP [Clostridia bacterium]
MNAFIRFAFIVLTFLLSVFSLIFLLMMINNDVLSQMIILVTYLRDQRTYQIIAIVFWLAVLILCLSGLVYSILSGRLRRSRVRTSEIGTIDIGVDAIESIALNSARTAQCGIKSAKAKVAPAKGDKITILLNAVLYSDVEVPVMMAKVQDRIKKDVERYTGIPVAKVIIRVSRVEPVAARVER